MPFQAITYNIRAGFENEIAELFKDFERVDNVVLSVGNNEVGRLLGTAVFIKDSTMVRVIHYEGDFSAVGRHMSTQAGVHKLEQKLKPYLAEDRHTESPENFQRHFTRSLMRRISALGSASEPGGE